ncbi:uncharacterized protein LOC101850727 [Aplysia californica]|uniref:Uncharacterized protein LOC101850727 n=1 Tax=Aplysia californica TaxID=6500 RepID=A0ABM0JSJ1_APLCA|nr:uncharacterized protein LOC101850727 [Aplysia californica]
MLYLEKGGVTNTLELSEAQQVRKMTDDLSGTQLEICWSKKKTKTIFICPTSADCESWVRALRTAMVHKDSGDGAMRNRPNSSSTFYFSSDNDDSVYATISNSKVKPVSDPPQQSKETVSISSEYSLPDDSVPDSSENVTGIYEDVEPSFGNNVAGKCSSDVAVEEPCDEDGDGLYSDAFTEKKAQQGNSTLSCGLYTDASSMKKALQGNATLSSVTSSPVSHKLSDSEEVSEHPVSEGNEDNEVLADDGDDNTGLFEIMSEALSGTDDDVELKDLELPLRAEDHQPLQALSDFLDNNKSVCRASSSAIVSSLDEEDPVTKLKLYLASLNFSS